MAVKVQVPRQALLVRFLLHPVGKTLVALSVITLTALLVVFTYYYAKYSRLIEAKLTAGPFTATSLLFAAPHSVMVGEETTAPKIIAELRRCGYTESSKNRTGYYTERPDGGVEVYPGPASYFGPESAVLKFGAGKVSQIISLRDNTERTEYQLEPELISNLFDKNRERRRIVHFSDIPPVLVNAVISAEDKRFFQHSGFDPLRIMKAAYVDVREHRNAQGASTLSMQLARGFWLDQKKTWRRKMAEFMITMHLEQKLSKEQIFEFYANEVDLGRRGSFGIRGFGEASQVYFGKDISRLTIAEAATLAGLVQRPSYTNPIRWPDRARGRRNIVLQLMRDNKYITLPQYEDAVESPLVLSKHDMESTEAPYFVDLVNDRLVDHFQDRDFQANAFRVYTTLDMDLQRDAAEAVRIGMEEVDKRIFSRTHPKVKKGKGLKSEPVATAPPGTTLPQVALIAMDPITGEIKALIGGRNYSASQLNHALSKRQPGSVFKPFVYATALNTGLAGGTQVFTPVSMLPDAPKTFYYDNRPYQPANFEHKYFGNVTVRQAIAKSLNIPTVELAEAVGYGNVVDLARRAGLNMDIRPTPAVALGAYEVTPLEIAGAYSIYADRGIFVKPSFIASIRDVRGEEIFDSKPEKRSVLDPRVTYLMVSLLEEVLRSGTGAGIHARGFNLPAAGKTGTSHDGWFAGFTSKLICVVWVGYDDNRPLDLEGAHSALPVWAEFMKRAHLHRQYRNVTQFEAPSGIVSVQIDPLSGQLATPSCPQVRTEVFIEGTQPVELCRLHGGGGTQVAGWDAAGSPNAPPPPPSAPANFETPAPPQRRAAIPVAPAAPPAPASAAKAANVEANAPQPRPTEQRKHGLMDRLRGVFK